MNSLRHGLRARTVVLPGENREEFNQLCDDLEREWTPQSRTAKFYLEQMAVSQWKSTRMEVAEAGISRSPSPPKPSFPSSDRLWQAQCRLERSYARAQRELERLQAYRPRKFQRAGSSPRHHPRPSRLNTFLLLRRRRPLQAATGSARPGSQRHSRRGCGAPKPSSHCRVSNRPARPRREAVFNLSSGNCRP